MSKAFTPVGDKCISCIHVINPLSDRHEIVWDEVNQQYRRQCAKCRDVLKGYHQGSRNTAESSVLSISRPVQRDSK